MRAMLVTVCISLLSAGLACADEKTTADKINGRRFVDIERDMIAAMRKETTAQTFAERAEAIQSLAELHREIVRDARFATSDTLKEFRGKIAVRLISVKSQLQRKLANQTNAARRRPHSPALPADNLSATEIETVISANVALAAMSMSGPAQTFAQVGGARGGGIRDDGQALVELIEATINPKFWDVNGGPGSIIYFAPLRCLVVRATDEVHQNVGGVVGALRAAGQ